MTSVRFDTIQTAKRRLESTRLAIDFSKLYYENLQREFVSELLKSHGEFLLRKGGDGGRVLSVNRRGEILHFKFSATTERSYKMDNRSFETLESLVTYYYETGTKLAGSQEAELLTPVLNTLELIEYSRLVFSQELGKGNFGEVWRARLFPSDSKKSVLGKDVAVKILALNTSEKDRAECMAEARLMSTLNHENIVRLEGMSFWKDDEASPLKMLIVLEFCKLGSLDKLLQKDMVGKRGKERSLFDAAKGIAYLHEKTVIHRDIASRNCLVYHASESYVIKVADFGLSRTVSTVYSLVTKRRLPIFSTPPDTLRYRKWTSASDVWSYGVLMQEVYNAGKNPYEAHYGRTPLKEIVVEMSKGFRLPTPGIMPTGLAQLSVKCLATKEEERPKMKEIVEELTKLVGHSRNEGDVKQ